MSPASQTEKLQQYRAYLETLAMIHLNPRLKTRFGWSDIIQQTWIEAYRDMDSLEKLDEPARRRRLYRMLVNNLRDRIEHERARCRDVYREQSLEQGCVESSNRLASWLAMEAKDPGEEAENHDRRVRVMEAVALLPERERQALILQRYHGWKLREIADHLECTVGAVAGLHARALGRLREMLADLETEQ